MSAALFATASNEPARFTAVCDTLTDHGFQLRVLRTGGWWAWRIDWARNCPGFADLEAFSSEIKGESHEHSA